jgi:glycosyltransferase involved in cell wall biosynthesis
LEVIVVDAFSRDSTASIAASFGARIIQRDDNPAGARNFGVEYSRGEYVLFLDSDQALSPTVVEECMRISADGKTGMVKIPEVFVGTSFWGVCSATWKNTYDMVERRYGSRLSLVRGKPRFFVKDHLQRAGMFDQSLLWGEDYDLYERLKGLGVAEAVCKSPLYHYELTSLRKMAIKGIRYGESVPRVRVKAKGQGFSVMLTHAALTLARMLTGASSPTVFLGCAILLYFRASTNAIGFVVSSLSAPTLLGHS